MRNIIVVVLKLLLIYNLIHFNPISIERVWITNELRNEIISHFKWDISEYEVIEEIFSRDPFPRTVITLKKWIDLKDAEQFFTARGYTLDESTDASIQQNYNKNTKFYNQQVYVRTDKIVILPLSSGYEFIVQILVGLVFGWIIWGWKSYESDKTLKPE